MSDVFRTMVVPADQAPLARSIANMFAGGSDQHMWIVGLSADGQAPATHYISTGAVPEAYQVMAPCQTWEVDKDGNWVMTDEYPGDPVTIYEACQAADPPVPCTQAEVEELFLDADVTDQGPWTAMSRLGLKPVYPEEPPPPVPENTDG